MSSGGAERKEFFDQTLDQFGDALWRLTGGYARTEADREDLYQEILIALWQSLPRFEGRSSLRTFVYRIAHNRGVSYRKYEARRDHGSIDKVVIRDPAAGPDERVQVARRREQLRETVRTLSPALRQPIMLHLDGLPNTEMAEIVGISEGNVAVRLSRARKSIQTALQTRDDHE